jgi:hypothetical protein
MGDYAKDVNVFLSDYEVEAREAEKKGWFAKLRSLGKPDKLVSAAWGACIRLCSHKTAAEAHEFACRAMSACVEFNLAKLRGAVH